MNTPTQPTTNHENCSNIRAGHDCIDRDLPLTQWCGFCASYVRASANAAIYTLNPAA